LASVFNAERRFAISSLYVASSLLAFILPLSLRP
jgi:hypothetical protein